MLSRLTQLLQSLSINLTVLMTKWPKLKARLLSAFSGALGDALHSLKFLPSYYRMNEKIWLEGMLVDWLQKSMFDKWVKRFLVHSAYLFSERVIFDFVVRFYIDYVIWPAHHYSIFDVKSIATLLSFLVLLVFTWLITLNFLTMFSILFW